MSDYSVIADVSRIMVSKLQRVLVPDLISGNDKIEEKELIWNIQS